MKLTDSHMISFGPIPSRRLGQSLGINNIPPKVCTYSCRYCQVGLTKKMQIDREKFYEPEIIVKATRDRIEKTRKRGELIHYLSFVPDGEPTLDINLGREIELLKPLGIKIAVITNSSLIWREDVRDELMKADWVSLKLDSALDEVWRKINRPYGSLEISSILDGMLEFRKSYDGDLMTETMLVEGINDGDDNIKEIAAFLSHLKPLKAYLSIPTRPPAEKVVRAPSETIINRAYQIIQKSTAQVEYLIGYEGNAFTFTGDVIKDLLSITAVHPMSEEAVDEFLAQAGADWSCIHSLVAHGELVQTEYEGRKYYTMRLPR